MQVRATCVNCAIRVGRDGVGQDHKPGAPAVGVRPPSGRAAGDRATGLVSEWGAAVQHDRRRMPPVPGAQLRDRDCLQGGRELRAEIAAPSSTDGATLPGPYRSPGTQGTIGQALAHDLSASFASRQPLRARQTPPCLLDGLYPRATSPLNITATSTALGYPLETSSSGA